MGHTTEESEPYSATVLIVDDQPENLGILSELLRTADYQVKAARSGKAALRYATVTPRPDLILLDVMMPELDGYQVLERLRGDPQTCDIPVIFLTALGDSTDEEQGLALGASDYITKPIRPAVVLARVRAQIEAKRARDWAKEQNQFLESEVARRTAENQLIQAVSIRALAHLAEIRDPETGFHILRTQAYVRLLAAHLQNHGSYSGILAPRYSELLTLSAPLHDIGKVGIPDHILLKPGKLNGDEWEIMKTHTRLGAEAIEMAERDIERPVEFLALAKEIARWHHERWDGNGYPDGLKGEAIPLSARIMALADAFDAIICPRVYKPSIGFAQAQDIIAANSGGQFDPEACGVFLAHFHDFQAIAQRYHDLA
jgi:putative two-component system response regulator